MRMRPEVAEAHLVRPGMFDDVFRIYPTSVTRAVCVCCQCYGNCVWVRLKCYVLEVRAKHLDKQRGAPRSRLSRSGSFTSIFHLTCGGDYAAGLASSPRVLHANQVITSSCSELAQ